MRTNPLLRLPELGQSIWLDYIRREMISSGELRRLIQDDGLRGVTSNPSIFAKAILESEDYQVDIRRLRGEGKTPNAIYEALSQHDVRIAADEFRKVYEETAGLDGYVSLEVNPHLAQDTAGTIAEARRLWSALDRPNVFIKVPGTKQGLPAIRELISEGINVNVTLLFSVTRYRQVVDAWLSGLEDRVQQDRPVDRIASVASFFISRIDALIDPLLQKHQEGPEAEIAKSVKGQVAIANARVAYQYYKQMVLGERFKHLASKGVQPQRLLWASTSTKDPEFSDIKYVEALIGPDTVNTLPVETLEAYRDHGNPKPRIEEGLKESEQLLEKLRDLGIDLEQVAIELEEEGAQKFSKPFDKLIKTLAETAQMANR